MIRVRDVLSSLLWWYFAASLVLLVAALAVGNWFTTPVHATFAHLVLSGMVRVGLWSIGSAVVVFFISLGLGLLEIMVARGARWLGGMAFATGVVLLALAVMADGVNVRFDESPAVRITTAIVNPDKAAPIEAGATVHLANWKRSGGEPVKAKFDPRVFRLDADGKSATFETREGFLGFPYAAEFR